MNTIICGDVLSELYGLLSCHQLHRPAATYSCNCCSLVFEHQHQRYTFLRSYLNCCRTTLYFTSTERSSHTEPLLQRQDLCKRRTVTAQLFAILKQALLNLSDVTTSIQNVKRLARVLHQGIACEINSKQLTGGAEMFRNTFKQIVGVIEDNLSNEFEYLPASFSYSYLRAKDRVMIPEISSAARVALSCFSTCQRVPVVL